MSNDAVTSGTGEFRALIAAAAERDVLRGELRLVTAKRDLRKKGMLLIRTTGSSHNRLLRPVFLACLPAFGANQPPE